jgi:Rieske Fe-S protein
MVIKFSYQRRSSMKEQGFSKNEFLSTTAFGLLAFGILIVLIGSVVIVIHETVSRFKYPIVIDLTMPQYQVLANVGGAIKITNPKDNGYPIIVNRVSESKVVALSSKCPYLGCEVSLPENNVIKCPCHGSMIDGSGKIILGPAKKALKAFKVRFKGTTITIR